MYRKFQYLIILIVIVVGLGLYAFFIPGSLNNGIIGITAIVIVCYTIETARLADLTEKQIKINIKPVIIVLQVGDNFRIKNVGKSAALNIGIGDVIKRKSTEEYFYKFIHIPVLAEMDEVNVSVTPIRNGEAIGSSGEVALAMKYLNTYDEQPYQLEIDYMDIENGKWQTVTLINKIGIHFKSIKGII